jgi:hypothetical protein
MNILGFGTPELVVLVSIVAIAVIIAYVVKVVRKGAASK